MKKPTTVPYRTAHRKGYKNIPIPCTYITKKCCCGFGQNNNGPDPDPTFQIVPDPPGPTSPGSDRRDPGPQHCHKVPLPRFIVNLDISQLRGKPKRPAQMWDFASHSDMWVGASLSYLFYEHDRNYRSNAIQYPLML
jgi:hypothetical protein